MNNIHSDSNQENNQVYTKEINHSLSSNYQINITQQYIKSCCKITENKESQSETHYGTGFFGKIKDILNQNWIYGLFTNNQILEEQCLDDNYSFSIIFDFEQKTEYNITIQKNQFRITCPFFEFTFIELNQTQHPFINNIEFIECIYETQLLQKETNIFIIHHSNEITYSQCKIIEIYGNQILYETTNPLSGTIIFTQEGNIIGIQLNKSKEKYQKGITMFPIIYSIQKMKFYYGENFKSKYNQGKQTLTNEEIEKLKEINLIPTSNPRLFKFNHSSNKKNKIKEIFFYRSSFS